MGIIMAKVPQEVPVEKAITEDTVKTRAGMISEGRVDLTAWAK